MHFFQSKRKAYVYLLECAVPCRGNVELTRANTTNLLSQVIVEFIVDVVQSFHSSVNIRKVTLKLGTMSHVCVVTGTCLVFMVLES